MAVPTISFVGTKAVDCDSTTGFSAGNLDTDIFLEGTGSVGVKTSNTLSRLVDSSITGGPYDFSSGGGNEGEHIFGHFNGLTPLNSTSGMRIVVGNGTDQGEWDVGPPAGYSGGFLARVVSPDADFTRIVAGTWTTAGNPAQLSAVSEMGGGMQTTTSIMGNFNNTLVDSYSVGLGYRLEDGDATTPGAFLDVAEWDTGATTRFHGGVRVLNNIIFPISQILIGPATGTAACRVESTGEVIVFEAASLAAADFFKIEARGSGTVVITNGAQFRAADRTVIGWGLSVIDSANWTDTGSTFQGAATGVVLNSASTFTGSSFLECGTVTQNSADMENVTVKDGSSTVGIEIADTTLWTGGDVEGCTTGLKYTGAATSITIDGTRFSGNTTDIEVDNASDVTVNLLNGANALTATNIGAGGVSIVNSVAVSVAAIDNDTKTAIGSPAILLESAGAPLPSDAAVTISVASGTATVTHTGHGIPDGEKVAIRGSTTDGVNGMKTVTVTGANSYTFTTSAADGAAAGVITSTAVILGGTGTAGGVLSRTDFAFTSDQPVRGWARSATGSTLYRQADIAGTITDAGFAATASLVRDDQ